MFTTTKTPLFTPNTDFMSIEKDMLAVPVSHLRSQSVKKSLKSFKRAFLRHMTPLRITPEAGDQSSKQSGSSVYTRTNKPISLGNTAVNSEEEITTVKSEEEFVPMEVQGEYWAYEKFNEFISKAEIPNGTAAFTRSFFCDRVRRDSASLLGKYVDLGRDTDQLCNTVETFGILWYNILRARNTADRYVALATHAKLLNTRLSEFAIAAVTLQDAFAYFCPVEEMEVQGETLPFFDDCQAFLDKYEIIKQSPIFSKLYKFSMYSMALSIFAPLGLDMDYAKFDDVAQEAIKKKYHMGHDFVHCVLDTLLFLCQRGYQCYQSGSIMPMFHSEAKYQEWYDIAERLMRQSHFLSNPEVHGIDRFAYMADLKTTIEKGQSMRKCVQKKDEKILISRMLSSLELTHDLELTKRAAQKDRKTPLCLLVYGGSSIGKSTMENVLFQHYGKRRGLSTSSEFRYVRNPTEEYWSGMNSTQWCIILDDIGFLSPKLGTLDPSLAEMLCIANNVPFVPAQAELSDKGRTPVRAELVIGSTNTEDLNVVAYFSCPLAVQRRFPWIIDMKVREEFQNKMDRPGMLDSSKVPPAKVGEYPDLWSFTVKRVEPCGEERRGQMGRTVEYANFADMKQLLVWYNSVIDEHNSVQDTIMLGNTKMDETTLCGVCQMPKNWCSCLQLQNDEYENGTIDDREQIASYMEYIPYDNQPLVEVHPLIEYIDSFELITRLVCWFYLMVYIHMSSPWFRVPADYFLGYGWYARWILASRYKTRLARVAFGYAGRSVENRFGRHGKLIILGAVVASGIVLYKSIGCVKAFFFPADIPIGGKPNQRHTKMCVNVETGQQIITPGGDCCDTCECVGFLMRETDKTRVPCPHCCIGKLKTQGSTHSCVLSTVGRKPIADEVIVEKPSYVDPFPYSNDDLSQTTLCSKNDDGSLLKRHIEKATCVFSSHKDGIVRVITAVNVRGAVYMLPNHGIPQSTPFHLNIVGEQCANMTTSMKNILITESMVKRLPGQDLAFVMLRCRPPATNLTQYFCKRNFVGKLDGDYIGRDIKGSIWTTPVVNLLPAPATWKTHDEYVTQEVWNGCVQSPTSVGDCGSLLLSKTPVGWTILGIHMLGGGNKIAAMKVCLEDVVRACQMLEPNFVNRGRVEISAPSAQRTLGPLHVQSAIHRANPGVANIIGSFTGEFKQRGQTSVVETYIAPFLKEYGYNVNRTRPDMSKRPWELALNDTTRPVVLLNNDVLNKARDMFISETYMSNYSQVHVYSLDVAINGCAGVEYCDKMNRKTSAGAPYKRPKTKLMYFVDEASSTDMDVIPEVKDTIKDMIATYQRGERVHTVFCGHLKDEPVTFEKASLGKTRVFTASGMAYTLVVRMHLLSVIVFMQKNRFTFETGPGTVVQSLEWEAIREHLVQHGENQIVAGDYSKFDKRMPANVILAAFDVIIDICKKANYSQSELAVVRGIAYDTAFPTVDFNGDLIEFFGSNPSGHPLTVIINGIVNSLYMRYCYIMLRPLGVSDTFKKNVSLMTYGDDNIMGVSNTTPWFNHTAIQKVLCDVDIGYTMADKDAVSVPYITIDESNFLKRTWRWDEDIGAFVAPLDRSSIEKMLTVCVAKKNIGRPQHSMQVIATALREYFWYGREEFETSLIKFQDIVHKANLELYDDGSIFPTWEGLYADFWERSKHVKLLRPVERESTYA